MIYGNNKTSLLVSSQLPEFIRDNPDYANFVIFFQAYYEWMEQEGGVTQGTKNLLSYDDIDQTTSQFIDYFTNDFLPYFPKDALISKAQAVKVARQLYESKGTPASYQFLFRILFNSDVDIFYTKDAVLKASDGKWYVPKSLKVVDVQTGQTNEAFLNISNLRIIGETSKSIATVETSVIAGNKVEIFISNIERLFQSGEIVRVVDSNNQNILDSNGNPIRGKIVGQISQIKIDPKNRGLYYEAGDPVIVYGGLNSTTGIGATAEVSTTQTGGLERITVVNGGYGFQSYPNTVILIDQVGVNPYPKAHLVSINPDPQKTATLGLIPTDSISLKWNEYIGNVYFGGTAYSVGANTRDPEGLSGPNSPNWTGSPYRFAANYNANSNTTLANAFSFISLTTYPIGSIILDNAGSGITAAPNVSAQSLITTDVGTANLSSLGILAPIQIVNPGKGYRVNDTINILGGSGYGAYANVVGVYANGGISNVSYVYSAANTKQTHPLGGMGYGSGLPTLTITSSNTQAANASLVVTSILGSGTTLQAIPQPTVGSIITINILNPGEDYVAAPNVSFKVQDVLVSNVSVSSVPQKGDIVYQGANTNTASYIAYVDSVSQLNKNIDPTQSLYNLRTYNYTSTPNPLLPVKVNNKNIVLNMNGLVYSGYKNGVITYGDGSAKGTATFLNGLMIGEGQYLTTSGQPSGYDVLQNEDYNNFTYEITVEKEISKYRDILLNLLHPSGMKVLGRYKMSANLQYNTSYVEALQTGLLLQDYTGTPGSSVSIVTDFTNMSNNIVQFNTLGSIPLNTIITTGVPGVANSILEITPTNGPAIRSEVIAINNAANTVTLKENTWLTFANVAYISGRSGNSIINISSLTGSYDIINNGNYSNTRYPLMDIVYVGDTINIANNPILTVTSINYANNTLSFTPSLTANANGFMSVRRTYNNISDGSVKIFGPLGVQYIPQLSTEDDKVLTTEDNNIILLG